MSATTVPEIHIHLHLDNSFDFEKQVAATEQLIARLCTVSTPQPPPVVAENEKEASRRYDEAAGRFAQYVVLADSDKQRRVIEPWLRSGGEMPLRELVKLSGVTTQRHYSGVGSGLSRNLRKAGLPYKAANHLPDIQLGQWYGEHVVNGERVYVIAPELVPPLRRAFGIGL